MSSCLNYLPHLNKKFNELKIIRLINMIWFLLVQLPLRLVKALILSPSSKVQSISIKGSPYYQTASLADVMTEAYLCKDFPPLESSGKYARLYYSPALGLAVSLIVFGTVLRLNFLTKTQLITKSPRPVETPRRELIDVRDVPVEYDEELNIWCTLNCSTIKRPNSGVLRGIPTLGLPRRTVEQSTIARTLIFHPRRD